MTVPENLTAVVFDLGGVIVDLDEGETVKAFARLSGKSAEEVRRLYLGHPAFTDYETGKLDDQAFRDTLCDLLGCPISSSDLDAAWNAMLTALPSGKLDLLKRLQQKYRVFILSNTNSIHINFVNRNMIPAAGYSGSLDDFVHKVYYSHLVGERKPDAAIYQHLLTENNLVPEQVVFLDDKPVNVEAARKMGMHGLVIPDSNRVYDLFGTT